MKKLKVMTTFNGIGALSDAGKELGLKIGKSVVCEIDKFANKTYYANNRRYQKNKHVDDINTLLNDNKLLRRGTKFDMLVQTPPCQSFSMAGKRKGFSSDNGNLFKTAIDLQKKVDSDIVIYENVDGLVSHNRYLRVSEEFEDHYLVFRTGDKKDKSKYFKLSKEEVEENKYKITNEKDKKKKITYKKIDIGYESKFLVDNETDRLIGHTLMTIENLLLEDTRYNYYSKIINSLDMGLPQNRVRIFIIGIKKGLEINTFKFPKKEDSPNFYVFDILEDIDSISKDDYKKLKLQNIEEDNLVIEPYKKKKRDPKLSYYGKIKGVKYDTSARVLKPEVAAAIITGENIKYKVDDKHIRTLTIGERKKVHGFRKHFSLESVKYTQQAKQLGNTVSPSVYKELLKEIIKSVYINKMKDSIVKQQQIKSDSKLPSEIDLSLL